MKIMAITRRTVSLPEDLAKEIEKVARRDKLSFSAAVAALAGEAIRGRRSLKAMFRSLGAGASGLPDLGTEHERYLEEIFGNRDG